MIRVQQGVLEVPNDIGVHNYEIGCPPVCVLFYSIDVLVAGVMTTSIKSGWGVGVSSTQQFLVSGDNQDATNALVFSHGKIFDDRCIGAAGSTPAWIASYNGTTSSGFSLDWAAVAGHVGKRFAYLAFIDDEGLLVADAGIRELHNHFTGNEAYTGLGFQPEFMMFGAIHTDANPGDQHFFEDIGVATGPSNQAVMRNWNFAGGGADRVTRTGMVIGPDGQGNISLVSFDADGFTLNYGSALNFTFGPGFPTYRGFAYWAMANLDGVAFGTGTQPDADGTQAFSGLGFEPGAVLACSDSSAFRTTVTFHSMRSLGTAAKRPGGGIDHNVQWYAGESISPTNNARIEDTANLLFLSDDFSGGGTYDAVAAVDSFDSDGFILDWDVNDTVDREFFWVAWEAEAFPPCGGPLLVSFSGFHTHRPSGTQITTRGGHITPGEGSYDT